MYQAVSFAPGTLGTSGCEQAGEPGAGGLPFEEQTSLTLIHSWTSATPQFTISFTLRKPAISLVLLFLLTKKQ